MYVQRENKLRNLQLPKKWKMIEDFENEKLWFTSPRMGVEFAPLNSL